MHRERAGIGRHFKKPTIDPAHASNYTRSGLEVLLLVGFRSHLDRKTLDWKATRQGEVQGRAD